jgi:hypothetical protein
MKRLLQNSQGQSGNVTIVAMLMLLVLSMIGASVLLNTIARYNGSMKIGGWQEALSAAEAGADLALNSCRLTVVSGGTPFDTTSTPAWSLVDPTNANHQNVTFTSPLGNSYTLPMQYTVPTLTQSGQGSYQTWATVVVDAPPELIDSELNQWYRIRSTGYANLAGVARVSMDNPSDMGARRNNALRKFSFTKNRLTGQGITTPLTSRTVEVMAQPVNAFGAAIIAQGNLKAVTNAYVVDSFDSRDATKSTNGQYDVAKRQSNGTVYSNSILMPPNLAGDFYGNIVTRASSIVGAPIVHGGTTTLNATTNLPPPVSAPVWGSKISPNPTGGGAYQAGTVASPTYYVTSGAGNVTINPPAGGGTGAINIYFTDDFQGNVTVPVGIYTKIWLGGAMKTPNVNNLNNNASFLEFYGIGNTPNSQKIETKDTTGYYGMIYAPYAQIKTGAGAVYGSIVGYDVNIKNDIHYDEAFSAFGTAVDYVRASWVEDPR